MAVVSSRWRWALPVFVLVAIQLKLRGRLFNSLDILSLSSQQERKRHADKRRRQPADGCGLVTDTSLVRWRQYNETREIEELNSIVQCLQNQDNSKRTRMDPHVIFGVGPRDGFLANNIFRLDGCHQKVTTQILRSTISQYETLWFFGDSVMEQQFYSLLCWLDPTLGANTSRPFNNTKLEKTSEFENFYWTHNVVDDKDEDVAASSSHAHDASTTHLVFSRFGLSGLNEMQLYSKDFPHAIETLGSGGGDNDGGGGANKKKNAIIVHASAHYSSDRADPLSKVMSFVAEKSTQTNATVFFMEPHSEEWPTSNGQWFKPCMWFCPCAVMDPLRLAGKGNFTGSRVNLTQMLQGLVPIRSKLLQELYPEREFSNNVTKKMEDGCFPDCVPATWRMEAARRYFVENNINVTHHDPTASGSSVVKNDSSAAAAVTVPPPPSVTIVPVFWQMVGKGFTSGRRKGDCTHKSLDAVLMLNEQLVRTMIQKDSSDSKKKMGNS